MRDINEVLCFVRAVELKSITAAALDLGIPKSSVSRKIKSLEGRLGVTLLIRTTRSLNLTDSGKIYFEKSSLALKTLFNAEEIIEASKIKVEGILRITAPVVLASGELNHLIADFLELYPHVKINLNLTDKIVDLVVENYDLAFRFGKLKDSTMISYRLRPLEPVMVASPAYLKKNGIPKTITELKKHEFIGFAPNNNLLKFPFKYPNSKKEFLPKIRLTVDQIISVKECALNGLGLAILSKQIVEEELKENKLVLLFPNWTGEKMPMHLLYPGQKFLSPRLRAFIEFTKKFMVQV